METRINKFTNKHNWADMSDCFWCENVIHDYLGSWVDVYGETNCKYHPYAWNVAANIPTGNSAPHQDYLQVAEDMYQLYELRTKPKKKPSLKLVRHNASDTSINAALSIDVDSLEGKIYQAIKDKGDFGATQDELIAMFPTCSYSSVTARPSSLKAKGLVVDSGRRRKGKSGRLQVVLIAV